MGGFFGLDSAFNKYGTMLADVLILSFLWLIFSLPIFTIGASTTALFYVTTRRISDKEGYIFRDFFTSFKREFVKATITWIFILIVGGVLLFNLLNFSKFSVETNMNSIVSLIYYSVQLCLFIELCFFSVFVFPILSRFDVKLKTLFINSFFFANRHFPTTILCLVLGFGTFYLTAMYVPVLVFFSMGIYAFLSSYFFVKIFKKYRPELDADFDYTENEIV